MKTKVKKPKRELLVIGWMEHLDLPELDLHDIKAKIDTGARTSALHATDIETFDRDGNEWVRFRSGSDRIIKAEVYDKREIKNTSGIPEKRIVIRTKLKLVDRAWDISVSLADRSNMRFDMIVGRTALKHHNIAVHTRRSNLTDR